ncbi:hypothetical protein SAMN04487914_108142 [Arthrobacter sp. ok909]|uniref:hypothetical protein n=1 Tax=Arthrobacter sp. ok909 TaxID=1761746 RepID=UPI000885E5F5|nr:hypothetical protein [Arthrobacter sp. ok909]SDP34203.1 hypothetical protein SAMN04487914_108142 [Arthrobacter sp. ok909]
MTPRGKRFIDGVTTIAIWDRDYSNGELVESELAFFAQTTKGAVWLFVEYPEEYENGKLAGAPSTFISGIDKARAGIAMQAEPHRNTPAYVQAYAPGEDKEFLDLVTIKKLSSAELASVYARALAIDRRGYSVSKDVYATTPRAVVSTP